MEFMSSITSAWGAVLVTFIAVFALVLAFGQWLSKRQLRKRVRQIGESRRERRFTPPVAGSSSRKMKVVAALSRLSLPAEGWRDSRQGQKFIQAGLREDTAPPIYFAVKTTLALFVPAGVVLAALVFFPKAPLSSVALAALLLAAIGYYLPNLYLTWRAQQRIERARQSLPDMMDLLVIGIESGLGMDAAINRVAREIQRGNPVLAEEFFLAGMEIRLGGGRIDALRNLSRRLPMDDLGTLVAMLAQADKYGTGLGASLRVQADAMRVKRAQRAEDIASKIPLKLAFPLIVFIFPPLLLVLVGPAFISVSKALMG